PALHVERQPFLGEPLQDLKISTPVSSTVWLHRGCEDVLPQLLRLVKSGSPPCWHRPDDAGPGPLRSGRRGPRSPPENPRPRFPIQSRTLRQKAARTATRTNRGLDRPANPKAGNPSLNSNTGCLKVVDTFRTVYGHLSVEELDERYVRCQDTTASWHFQVVWLLTRGHNVSQVSEATAF